MFYNLGKDNKYLLIIKWGELGKTELYFFNSEENLKKWLSHWKKGAFDIIKQYKLEEIK